MYSKIEFFKKGKKMKPSFFFEYVNSHFMKEITRAGLRRVHYLRKQNNNDRVTMIII